MSEPSVPAQPTGTVAFLITDIEGSTRLWEQHPAAMATALARHDAILRAAIESHEGHIFKTVGDGFCAAFSTAELAVEAALAAQTALAGEPWPNETIILARMALHTGVAEERDGDYLGSTVNRVARLLAAAHGGQVLVSAATLELVRGRLPDAGELRDLGVVNLRGLARPDHVFQLVHPLLRNEFPPLRSLDAPGSPNNLPQQLTSFIGREREVGEIKVLLNRTHLLTLIGAGGSGKTRLSLEVAADLLEDEPDGVWLVELASLSDPAFVPHAVADVLKVREEAGRSIPETLVAWLKPKQLLIVLDNCEHLLSACAELVAYINRNCPRVRILASSREPMNVAGEQAYRVPSLAVPALKQIEPLETLIQYDAIRLFVERARTVAPSFAVTDRNSRGVAQVCVQLDGIPFAIELAAARIRSLSVDEVNTRLDQRFRLLIGGSRANLPRQQTLRALIDWSYDLLNNQEKLLLCRLSIFVGGWTLDAAEAIVSGDGVEDWEVLDLLTSLVDKSLVVFEATGEHGRYRLLETVRQYARERLAETIDLPGTDVNAVAARAAAWFLALAAEAALHYEGADQALWFQRLEGELDNIRASLAWYESVDDGAESSLAFMGDLGLFWGVRGFVTEGRQWLAKALGRIQYSRGDTAWNASVALADALQEAGNLAYFQGDYAESRPLMEDALVRYRRLGSERGISLGLSNLATLTINLGDYTAAKSLLEESLVMQRRINDHSGLGHAYYSLGHIAYNEGDIAAARSFFGESATHRKQIGDLRGIASALTSVGASASRLGDHAAARANLEEALQMAREIKDLRAIANALASLSSAVAKQSDWAAARSYLEESLPIYDELGNQEGIAYCLESMAGIGFAERDFAAARRCFHQSLTIYRKLADQEGVIAVLEGQAKIELEEDAPARAAQILGAAASIRAALSSTLPAEEQDAVDKSKSAARHALGEEAFDRAWAAGLALDWKAAADYALADSAKSEARSLSKD